MRITEVPATLEERLVRCVDSRGITLKVTVPTLNQEAFACINEPVLLLLFRKSYECETTGLFTVLTSGVGMDGDS